jgi:GNAT superfamily N-acetyltransferase
MLLSRIDSNLFQFYEYAAVVSGRASIRCAGFSYVDLQPSPWAKAVYGLDFPPGGGIPPELSAGIAEGSIPNKIRVGPGSLPLDIETRLAEAGCVASRVSRGMTLDIKKRIVAQVPAGLTIDMLAADEDYQAFARIVAANLFETGIETGPAFAKVLRSIEGARGFGFLAKANGEAVSTAFAFIDSEGFGGIYFVATERSMRGRGFGTATVSAALGELGPRGVRGCILHATECGKPVYERLGFEDACPLVIYSFPTNSL